MPRIVAALTACALFGCSTVQTRLDTTRRIDVEPGAFSNSYKQDAKPISDLGERLKEHPAAGPRMSGIGVKSGAAIVLGLVGSTLILVDSVSNFSSTVDETSNPLKKVDHSYTLTLIGAGVLLAAIPFTIMANRQLATAVEAYNDSFNAGSPAASSGPASSIRRPTADEISAYAATLPPMDAGDVRFAGASIVREAALPAEAH